MYHSRVSGRGLFQAVSEGYGQPIETFGRTDQGETPVSLINIALAACVTMCVQGYFAKYHHQYDMAVETHAKHMAGRFELTVALDELLTPDVEEALRAYVDDRCRVKQLLRPDLSLELVFVVGTQEMP